MTPGQWLTLAYRMPVLQLEQSLIFPPAELARDDGLLAVGGDLSSERLLAAYRLGIFPWYSSGEPILWWSPDPRCVMFPEEFRLPARAERMRRQARFDISFDRAFPRVVAGCAGKRPGQPPGTWITPEMASAYETLHRLGHAHSLECWQDGELVGGLYGVALGGVFFGESAFSRESGASKIAMAHLASRLTDWGFTLIDCQVASPHLFSLGARNIPGAEFRRLLAAGLALSGKPGPWGDKSESCGTRP